MDIKLRRKETKVYDLVALSADLGFTPVRVSNRYYSLEEHDSVMIDTVRNTFKQYSTNDFVDAVASGRQALATSIELSVESHRLCYEAERSRREGRTLIF